MDQITSCRGGFGGALHVVQVEFGLCASVAMASDHQESAAQQQGLSLDGHLVEGMVNQIQNPIDFHEVRDQRSCDAVEWILGVQEKDPVANSEGWRRIAIDRQWRLRLSVRGILLHSVTTFPVDWPGVSTVRIETGGLAWANAEPVSGAGMLATGD